MATNYRVALCAARIKFFKNAKVYNVKLPIIKRYVTLKHLAISIDLKYTLKYKKDCGDNIGNPTFKPSWVRQLNDTHALSRRRAKLLKHPLSLVLSKSICSKS